MSAAAPAPAAAPADDELSSLALPLSDDGLSDDDVRPPSRSQQGEHDEAWQDGNETGGVVEEEKAGGGDTPCSQHQQHQHQHQQQQHQHQHQHQHQQAPKEWEQQQQQQQQQSLLGTGEGGREGGGRGGGGQEGGGLPLFSSSSNHQQQHHHQQKLHGRGGGGGGGGGVPYHSFEPSMLNTRVTFQLPEGNKTMSFGELVAGLWQQFTSDNPAQPHPLASSSPAGNPEHPILSLLNAKGGVKHKKSVTTIRITVHLMAAFGSHVSQSLLYHQSQFFF